MGAPSSVAASVASHIYLKKKKKKEDKLYFRFFFHLFIYFFVSPHPDYFEFKLLIKGDKASKHHKQHFEFKYHPPVVDKSFTKINSKIKILA